MGDTAGMTSAQASNMMEASMAASAISSVASGVENASAIKAQGDYSSSIANTNAAMAKLKATQVQQTGDIAASRKNLQTQAEVGSTLAAQGASGVDVRSGSPAMTRAGITTAGGIDEATIRNNAARQAWGYQVQASEDTFQGQFEQMTAKQRSTQSLVTGGLSAISGPMAMMSQAALWQYRYGLKGTPGKPYPAADMTNDDSFWSGEYASPGSNPGSDLNL